MFRISGQSMLAVRKIFWEKPRAGIFPQVIPLTSEAFSDPFLVHHGETVQLRLERNGILLTSSARAEQDGRLGQVIVVRESGIFFYAQGSGYRQGGSQNAIGAAKK